MTNINIECHACGANIELTKTLAAPLLDTQRKEFEDRFEQQKRAQNQREKELNNRESELINQDQEIEKRVAAQLETRLKQEKEDFDRKYQLQINSLTERLEEKYDELNKAQQTELEMRKARDEAVQAKNKAQLEIERQVDQRLATVREQATESANDKANKKIAEQDQILQSLRKQISDMERKADPTAAHLHGEIEESAITSKLRMEFPQDNFDRVKKGARGADIKQQVRLPNGRIAGTLLIEVKNTQNWDNNWIPKLKDDQRVNGADIPVIVSRTLPHNINSFAHIDNVWVCAAHLVVPLISCLRNGILGVAREKSANAISSDRKEQIFQYLKSNSFSMRISGIVEAYDAMRNELDREKKSQHNYWAKREVSLNRMLQGISGLSGDFQQLGGPGVLEDQPYDSLEHSPVHADKNTIEHRQTSSQQAHTTIAASRTTATTEPETVQNLYGDGGPKAGWASSGQEPFVAPPANKTVTQDLPNIQFKPIPSNTVNQTNATQTSGTTDSEECKLNILEVLVHTGQTITVGSPLVSILDNNGQVRIINSTTQGTVTGISLSDGQFLTEEEIYLAFSVDP